MKIKNRTSLISRTAAGPCFFALHAAAATGGLVLACIPVDAIEPDQANATEHAMEDDDGGWESAESADETGPDDQVVCDWFCEDERLSYKWRCSGRADAELDGLFAGPGDVLPFTAPTYFFGTSHTPPQAYEDATVTACCLAEYDYELDPPPDDPNAPHANYCAWDCMQTSCVWIADSLWELSEEIPVIAVSYRNQLKNLSNYVAANLDECTAQLTAEPSTFSLGSPELYPAGYQGVFTVPDNEEDWPDFSGLELTASCSISGWDIPESEEDYEICAGYCDNDMDAFADAVGGQGSVWDCETATTFAATEVSCSAQPVSGACPSGDIETNPVPVPEVPRRTSGTFDGWIVHMPRWVVADPNNPTEPEMNAIFDACVDACELEWSDNADVEPTCDVEEFETPTLREVGGAPTSLVAAEYADGTDLFVGQTLACDLRTDCCSAFDEDVCAARPDRPTEASVPLSRGEEWTLGISGEMEADSPNAVAPASASISGTIGYSECPGGSDASTCPFYLGSLEFELDEPLEIVLECNSSYETFELESLTVRLAEPAFGMAAAGNDWNAFPPGALVFEGEGVVNGIPIAARHPTDEPVYIFGKNGWKQLQGNNGAWIVVNVPCNGLDEEVLVWWGFDATSWPGERPNIAINVPSTVTCPSSVSLAYTATDQENDIVSVRWWVDGVLLEAGTTSITFSAAHQLKAEVRDSRGSTYTKTKNVSCQ